MSFLNREIHFQRNLAGGFNIYLMKSLLEKNVRFDSIFICVNKRQHNNITIYL